MSSPTNEATEDQLAALTRFASKNGRYWKCKLVNAWLSGADERLPDGGLLRQVRNELGIQWLRDMSLKQPVLEQLPELCPA